MSAPRPSSVDAVFVGLDAAALILAARLLKEKKSVLILDIENLQNSGVTYLPLHQDFLSRTFGAPFSRVAPLEVTLAYGRERIVLKSGSASSQFGLFKEFESLLEAPVGELQSRYRNVHLQMKQLWKQRKKPGSRSKGRSEESRELEREALIWALFECLPSKLLPDEKTLKAIRSYSQIFQGNAGDLFREVEKAFTEKGAQVIRLKEFPRFALRKGRVEEIHWEGKSAVADLVILSEGIEWVRRKSESTGLFPFRGLKKSPRVDGTFVQIELELGKDAVPREVPRHVVIYERDQPPIEVRWLTDPAPGGCRVQVRAGLSLLESVRTPSQFQMIQLRMLRVFTQVYPFVERHIRAVKPMAAVPDARVLGLSQKVMSGKGIGIRGGPKNLWVVSRESYPELGHFGVWLAATQVWARLGTRIHRDRLREQKRARTSLSS